VRAVGRSALAPELAPTRGQLHFDAAKLERWVKQGEALAVAESEFSRTGHMPQPPKRQTRSVRSVTGKAVASVPGFVLVGVIGVQPGTTPVKDTASQIVPRVARALSRPGISRDVVFKGKSSTTLTRIRSIPRTPLGWSGSRRTVNDRWDASSAASSWRSRPRKHAAAQA
jgi:hypothetical protein